MSKIEIRLASYRGINQLGELIINILMSSTLEFFEREISSVDENLSFTKYPFLGGE